jgi:hypothetical protein
MSPTPDPEEQAPPAAPELSEAERRRRRALVFGDVLPDSSRDAGGDGWFEREPREGSDEWFRRQVPPHHG